MKRTTIAPSSDGVLQAVCQRLKQQRPPTISQTKELLEQLAIAELEIGILRAALDDACTTLEEALMALARERQALPQSSKQLPTEPDRLKAVYVFFLERNCTETEHNAQERMVGV